MSTVMDKIEVTSKNREGSGTRRKKKAPIDVLPTRADGMPKIPYFRLAINIIFALMFFVGYRLYIDYHSFTVGLDYFEPEFQVYYMRLLYIQLTLIAALGAASLLWIWTSRPKEVNMSPLTELKIYNFIFLCFKLLFGLGF